jgi:amino acid transporter
MLRRLLKDLTDTIPRLLVSATVLALGAITFFALFRPQTSLDDAATVASIFAVVLYVLIRGSLVVLSHVHPPERQARSEPTILVLGLVAIAGMGFLLGVALVVSAPLYWAFGLKWAGWPATVAGFALLLLAGSVAEYLSPDRIERLSRRLRVKARHDEGSLPGLDLLVTRLLDLNVTREALRPHRSAHS